MIAASRNNLVAVGLVVVIGGANGVAIKYVNRELPIIWGVALRFGIAAAVLLVLMLVMRLPIPSVRLLFGASVFGVLNIAASHVFLHWGLQYTSAASAQVLLATVPLATLLLAVVQRVELANLAAAIGAVISLVGVGLIYWEELGEGGQLAGLLALFLSGLCVAQASVLLKRLPAMDPFVTNVVAVSVAAPMLVILATLAGEPWTLPQTLSGWVALAYLAVPGSAVLFALYIYLLQRVGPSMASNVFLLFPLTATILSAIVLAATPRPSFLIGTTVVLFGVYWGLSRGESDRKRSARTACQ